MNKEYEQLSVEFSAKAQRLFIYLYQQFRESTKKLDRQKDENVFQLQVSKFLSTLELQLQQIASELLRKDKAIKNTDECGMILKNNIKIYLAEFRQKTKLL